MEFSSAVARLKYCLRSAAARRPALLQLIYGRLQRHRNLLVCADTDVVIEGYPRSGNTFALRAFKMANPEAHVAHHMHAQAQVMRAVERGIPAMVLIRHPDSAVRSMLVRHPQIGLRMALKAYIQFHEDLRPFADGFVLVPFEQLQVNFGVAIEGVNRRFGTGFELFRHSANTVEQIYRDMEQANVAAYRTLKVTHVPRPDAARETLKQGVRLKDEPVLLAQAREAYAKLMRAAGFEPADAAPASGVIDVLSR